jgi:hypothetical protein
MSDIRFSQLSPSELQKMKQARSQITKAEQDMADVVMKHLHITPLAEDIKVKQAKEQERTVTVIRDGCCKVVGVYIDPPGICAPVS